MLLSEWLGFVIGVNGKVPLIATRLYRWKSLQIDRRSRRHHDYQHRRYHYRIIIFVMITVSGHESMAFSSCE